MQTFDLKLTNGTVWTPGGPVRGDVGVRNGKIAGIGVSGDAGEVIDCTGLDILPGVGLNSSSPELLDPEMMIRWSDDGGYSWSAERRVELGRLGQTVKRAVIRRLGRTTQQGRIFEFSVSAAVARAWLGASVDIEKLAA